MSFHYKQSYFTLRLDTKIDLNAGTEPKIYWESPNGVKGYWDAVIDDTFLTYEVQPEDINEVGMWTLQCFVEFDDRTAISDKVELEIKENLKDTFNE